MEPKQTISIDEFKKIEIKIGHILLAEKIEGSEKLLKLSVDFGLKPQSGSPDPERDTISSGLGERDIRQILSGIQVYFSDPSVLVGKKCAFATNLEPRKMMGLESQGMILAVNGGEGDFTFFSLLETTPETVPGSTVK